MPDRFIIEATMYEKSGSLFTALPPRQPWSGKVFPGGDGIATASRRVLEMEVNREGAQMADSEVVAHPTLVIKRLSLLSMFGLVRYVPFEPVPLERPEQPTSL